MASTDAATTAVVEYTIRTKCLTEFLGTVIGIYLGCSVVANALLPGAKGQSMGFGWIALGYGLAFYFPGVFFGHVSANLNPAMCLADLITGSLNVQEFFALSAAEIAGAFIGGVLVWLHWLPHFKTVPEPPAANAADNLLRKRDALPKQAVEISSYNPRPSGPAAAAAAHQQQQQVAGAAGAGASSLRRRRRPGSGTLGSPSGSVTASQAFQRISTTGTPAGQPGDHDGGSSHMGDGELDALRKPAQMVQHATYKVKRGVVGTIKEWLTDFMYYAVQHDEYRKPDHWKKTAGTTTGPSATTGMGRRSGSAGQRLSSDMAGDTTSSPRAQRYQGVHHDDSDGPGRVHGPLSPVMEDEETGTASGSHGGGHAGRLNGATSFRRGASGDAFAAEDDWSPGDDRVTRSVLALAYQQETLEAQIKLLAPALYYTSAALTAAPAAAAALAPSTQPSTQLHSSLIEPGGADDATAAVMDLGAGEAGKPDKHDDPHLPSPPVDGVQKPPALQVSGEGTAGGQVPGIVSPFGVLSHQPFSGPEDQFNINGPLAAVLAAGANAAAAGAAAPLARLPSSASGRLRPGLTQHDLTAAGINGLAAAAAGGAGEGPGGEVVAAAAAVAYNALDEERRKVMALYEAAVIADQNAKLSVFTTRPAIYAPPFNWLTEFLATIMLVLGIKLMAAQMSRQGLSGEVLQPLFVGLYIVCQVVGLGGPTGFSVNPARDLGPRIAHALLPIPNKGPSEWYYGWIPVTASLAGGAVGAGLFLAINSAIW